MELLLIVTGPKKSSTHCDVCLCFLDFFYSSHQSVQLPGLLLSHMKRLLKEKDFGLSADWFYVAAEQAGQEVA